MRINEYKCLEDFINEYNGKYEIGDEFHMGLEFEYKGQIYRFCRESNDPLFFIIYKRGPEIKINPNRFYNCLTQVEIFRCYSMKEVLETKIIDNRPFKDVIMDDNTLMLSKD